MDSVFFYLIAMMCIMLSVIVFIFVESFIGIFAFFSLLFPIAGYMILKRKGDG